MANELKFGSPIVLNNLASDPGAGFNGEMYYNTTNNVVRVYQNGAWTNVDSVSLPNHNIIVGNPSGASVAVDTNAAGDVLADSSTALTIKAGVITNTQVSGSAAIAYSKLNLTGSIVNADISASAAIARSKVATGTNFALLANNSSGLISDLGPLTNGQLLIGSTGTAASPSTLTAGTGISITNGAGSITIAATNAGSPGDISETSFSGANNVSSPANVTGFVFSNAVVRSFKALVSVFVNATSPLYETFELQGIQKGSSWEMAISSVGDASGVLFTITNAGQVQYVDNNYTGFTALTVKFRAITTSV